MTTIKQIEANRRNSQNSTGPRTEAGKAATRFNALKTGIDAETQVLPGESAEALAVLSAEYFDCHRPTTPEQRLQLDILISNEWLLRRLRRVEHQIWEAEFKAVAENEYADRQRPFGESYKRRDELFHRLQHRINSTHRQIHNALSALRQLRTADAPAELDRHLVPSEAVTAKIGLVPVVSRGVSQEVPPAGADSPTSPDSPGPIPLRRPDDGSGCPTKS